MGDYITIINSCVVICGQLALCMWFLLVQDWWVDKNCQCTDLQMFGTLRAQWFSMQTTRGSRSIPARLPFPLSVMQASAVFYDCFFRFCCVVRCLLASFLLLRWWHSFLFIFSASFGVQNYRILLPAKMLFQLCLFSTHCL